MVGGSHYHALEEFCHGTVSFSEEGLLSMHDPLLNRRVQKKSRNINFLSHETNITL